MADILTVINDAGVRDILEAMAEKPLDEKEISNICDLPFSTTYRKLDMLTEIGVLESEIEVNLSGNEICKYRLQLESLRITISDGELRHEIRRRE